MNADKILNTWWSKVKDVSPETVVKELRKHWDKFRKSPQLKNAWDKISLMYRLLRDVLKGDYPEFPKSKLALVVGALAYLLLSIDLIPDFIPVVGWLDDIIVVTWVFAQCKSELDRYAATHRQSADQGTAVNPVADAPTIDVPCND